MNISKWFWFLFPIVAFFAVEGDPPSGGEGDPVNNDPPANGSGQGDEPKLTQAEVDALIGKAKRGAKGQAAKEIFQTLGVENLEDIQKIIADNEAAKQAQMSDLEKAQAELEKQKQLIAQAEADKEAALQQVATQQLENAIVAKAGNFNDPRDVLTFIERSSIERNEDGTYTGIDEAIKALAESKPYLVKANEPATPKGTPSRFNNNQGQPQGNNNVPNAWENTRRLINF